MADQPTTARQRLTAALHAHTCHPDGEACAWGGEDYPGEGTCADVGEVGIEDAVIRWVATLFDDLRAPVRSGAQNAPLVAAAEQGIERRMRWPSMHWGNLHPDAWPHVAAAACESVELHLRSELTERGGDRG